MSLADKLEQDNEWAMRFARIAGLQSWAGEKGLPVSIEWWYANGEQIPNTLASVITFSRLMNDDIGPDTGNQMCLVWFWRTPETKLNRLTHKLFEAILKHAKYTGLLQINTIITNEDKLPKFKSFTCRPNIDFHVFCEGLGINSDEFMTMINSNEIPRLKPSYDWLGLLRVTDTKGQIKNVITHNKNIRNLDTELENMAHKLGMEDAMFRTDFAERAKEKLNILKEWKYL